MADGMGPAGPLDLVTACTARERLARPGRRNLQHLPPPLSTIPRSPAPDLDLESFLGQRVCSAMLHDRKRPRGDSDATRIPSRDNASEVVVFAIKREHTTFEFRPRKDYPRQAYKRCRHRLDVDGPNTAGLSSKKRRLRVDLVTSRLSQPYSQPASHIVNREGAKQGDRRFYKIALSLDASRRGVHVHTNSLLRYSLTNRLRARLGLGRPGQYDDAEEDNVQEEDDQSNTMAKVPWVPPGHPAPTTLKPPVRNRRSIGDPTCSVSSAKSSVGYAPQVLTRQSQSPLASPVPQSSLAALPRRSPRHRPIRSPELRPQRGSYDELDDDGFSYLQNGEDGVGSSGNDCEQVYSDFGAIFGGSGSDDDHSYEEYLDELDGLSWTTM